MATKHIVPPFFAKAAELQAKIGALEPVFSKSFDQNQIWFINQKLVSLANLKNRNSSLSRLFRAENKLSQYYYTTSYLHMLLEKFPHILEEDEIQISAFDLVEQVKEEPAGRILLLEEIPKVQRLIKGVYNDNKNLYQLHPRDFEEMIAEMLRKQDWEVKLTKQTRDQGVDIIALQHISGLPFKAVIECKRYAPNRKVGVEILRGFQSVILTQQANKGIIFTSSYFSPDAKRYQKEQLPFLLDLKDYDDIINWIKDENSEIVLPQIQIRK